MKVLLAVDGSPDSDAAIESVAARPWPAGTEIEILSVAHPFPLIPEPTMMGVAAHSESQAYQIERARKIVDSAAVTLRELAATSTVTTTVLEGSPKHLVVDEAESFGADLLVVGSQGHGRGRGHRFHLGSVSHAAALHAPCSVEIVRPRADRAGGS
jgi:nucleotide-binding universal stress UspA family protein